MVSWECDSGESVSRRFGVRESDGFAAVHQGRTVPYFRSFVHSPPLGARRDGLEARGGSATGLQSVFRHVSTTSAHAPACALVVRALS